MIGDFQSIAVPVSILRDSRIEDSGKLLYGLVRSRSAGFGYCTAKNKEFAFQLNLSVKRVSFLLGKLEQLGYLRREVIRDTETNEIMERRLYPENN